MSGAQQIRIVINHCNALTNAGLQHVLGRSVEFELTAEVGQRTQDPAVLMLTDFTRGVEMLSAFERAGADSSAVKVVIISESDREYEIRKAIKLGARGFINSNCQLSELLMGVRQAHFGKVYLCAHTVQRLAESLYRQPLTGREEDVLSFVTTGMCNKEIAIRLNLAVGTVKSHLRAIFNKLGVESRTQAIHAAERRGLLHSNHQTDMAEAPRPLSEVAKMLGMVAETI